MKISVRSITPNFRRAGMAFTNKEEEFDVDEKKLKILESEKMLVVRRLETKDKNKGGSTKE